MSEVTRIIDLIDHGDPSAADQLLPLVYDELRKLAAAKLAKEKAGQTLQPTALVHAAYIRLVDVKQAQEWNSRGHFFAAAAEAMRRILIDNARRKGRLKRGGERHRIDIDQVDLVSRIEPDELLRLNDVICQLAEEDPTAGDLVKLRYFAGLSINDAATAADIGLSTAYRHWAYARAWLHNALVGEDNGD